MFDALCLIMWIYFNVVAVTQEVERVSASQKVGSFILGFPNLRIKVLLGKTPNPALHLMCYLCASVCMRIKVCVNWWMWHVL